MYIADYPDNGDSPLNGCVRDSTSLPVALKDRSSAIRLNSWKILAAIFPLRVFTKSTSWIKKQKYVLQISEYLENTIYQKWISIDLGRSNGVFLDWFARHSKWANKRDNSSVENQKGINAFNLCPVENLKGTNAPGFPFQIFNHPTWFSSSLIDRTPCPCKPKVIEERYFFVQLCSIKCSCPSCFQPTPKTFVFNLSYSTLFKVIICMVLISPSRQG